MLSFIPIEILKSFVVFAGTAALCAAVEALIEYEKPAEVLVSNDDGDEGEGEGDEGEGDDGDEGEGEDIENCDNGGEDCSAGETRPAHVEFNGGTPKWVLDRPGMSVIHMTDSNFIDPTIQFFGHHPFGEPITE